MKKYIFLFLLLAFGFTICGCEFDSEIALFPEYVKIESTPVPTPTASPVSASVPTPSPMPTPTPLPAPTALAEEKSISQRAIVYYDTYSEHFYDPADGTRVILSFNCETPKLFIEANPAAAEKINSFFEELNRSYFAEEDHGIATEMDLETYLLSLAEDNYTSAALTGSSSTQILYSRKARVLRADDAIFGFELSEYTIADTDARDKHNYWFDAHSGNPLPEEELTQSIFAEEKKKTSGELSLSALSEAEQDAEIVDLVTVTADGENLLLSARGPVYDLSVKTVGFAGSFYENKPLWYCNCLEDRSVQLCAALPEEIPDVMISFSDESGTVTQLVLSKDASGSPVLASPKDFS